MKFNAAVLVFALLIAPAFAQEHGSELPPADVESAEAASYGVIDLQGYESDRSSKIDRDLVAPTMARFGVAGQYRFDWGEADGVVVLLVSGADQKLNLGEGHRLVAFRDGRVVLDTNAMDVATKPGEIAAIGSDGVRVFRWDGQAYQAASRSSDTR